MSHETIPLIKPFEPRQSPWWLPVGDCMFFTTPSSLSVQLAVLPSITSQFKGSNQASWIGTSYVQPSITFHLPIDSSPYLVSYLLSTCTFTPLYGRLCTILGRRAACQTALLATALGTLLCGISGGMVQLTVARFVRTCTFSIHLRYGRGGTDISC